MQQQQHLVSAGMNIIPGTGVESPQPYGGYAGPRPGSVVSTFVARQSMALGVTLVVCGSLAIIFNGVAIGVHETLSYIGHGFWVGCMLLIAGSLGIAAAVHKTRCTIVTFMVFSILTSVMTVSLLALGIAGAVTNACSKSCYGYGCGSYRYYDIDSYHYFHDYTPPCSDKIKAAVAMEALLAIIALVAGIACLWGSVIGCKALCCCAYNSNVGLPVVYSTPYNQPMVIYSQQQSAPPYTGPQILPAAGATMPTAPPPYIATGYMVQYWGQQQQQPTGPNFAGYTSAPAYNSGYPAQMPVTSLNAPPPAYAIDDNKL